MHENSYCQELHTEVGNNSIESQGPLIVLKYDGLVYDESATEENGSYKI